MNMERPLARIPPTKTLVPHEWKPSKQLPKQEILCVNLPSLVSTPVNFIP